MFTRMAYLSSEVAIEDLIRYGRTTLRFTCRPQVYGPGELSPINFGAEEVELVGNTYYAAAPLIIVRAAGTITVNGADTITIGAMPTGSNVYIDCADKTVYYIDSHMRRYSWMAATSMSADFPIIPAGGDQGEQGILTLSFARRSGTAQADDATVTPRRFVI
jgi:phage-related protein